MSERRYYGTGRKKYTSRHERVKEVHRCRHNNHDYIVPDEVLPGQDDDICEANDVIIWGEEKEEQSDSDISEMSTERISMNDDLDYEEQEAVVLTIDENKEKEDDDGFDFKALLNAIIFSELNENKQIHQLEDDAKLLTDNEEISHSTVNEFAKDMHDVLAGYNVEKAAIDDMFGVLSRHIHGIDWPIKRSRDDMIRNDLASYIDEDKRALRLDVCGSGCCAFIGKELEEAYFCPICNTPRFYKCNRGNCFTKPYGPCDHANRNSKHVFHYV